MGYAKIGLFVFSTTFVHTHVNNVVLRICEIVVLLYECFTLTGGNWQK